VTDPDGGPRPAAASGSATDRAYDWTRRAVLRGDIDAGALLTEGEVADAVGVSRTPVREAFLRLQVEGVLRLFPKRGALVVPVTAADVRDVIEARQLVEPWAFARAAGHPERGRVAATLRAAIDRQEACLAAGDDPGFQEADRAFHTVVVATAGNELLAAFYETLRDRQLRMGAAAARADTDRAEQILREHRAIAEAVATGDGPGVTSLLHVHIAATGAALRLLPPPPPD
jgi:DNA-binding GntR family transcriptional regulator